MNRYEGVRCVVTGAADGSGLATAQKYFAEGGKVLACDINHSGLAELEGAETLILDVTDHNCAAETESAGAHR